MATRPNRAMRPTPPIMAKYTTANGPILVVPGPKWALRPSCQSSNTNDAAETRGQGQSPCGLGDVIPLDRVPRPLDGDRTHDRRQGEHVAHVVIDPDAGRRPRVETGEAGIGSDERGEQSRPTRDNGKGGDVDHVAGTAGPTRPAVRGVRPSACRSQCRRPGAGRRFSRSGPATRHPVHEQPSNGASERTSMTDSKPQPRWRRGGRPFEGQALVRVARRRLCLAKGDAEDQVGDHHERHRGRSVPRPPRRARTGPSGRRWRR